MPSYMKNLISDLPDTVESSEQCNQENKSSNAPSRMEVLTSRVLLLNKALLTRLEARAPSASRRVSSGHKQGLWGWLVGERLSETLARVPF